MWNFIKGGLTMYKQKLILGVAPVKRSFLSMEEAKRQKDKFMAVIRDIKPVSYTHLTLPTILRV